MAKKIKFSLLQACFWCMFASSYSFMVAYLLSHGIEVAIAGFAMSAATLMGFFGQFIIGFICDKFNRSKIIYAVGMGYLLLILYLIMIGEKNNIFVIVMLGLFGFLQMPMASVLDGWIMKSFDDKASYSPIRSWGSIAYAVFALVFGSIIENFGFDSMLWFSVIFVVLNTVIVTLIPDIKQANSSVRINSNDIRRIFNKRFTFFLILMFLYGITTSPLLQMVSVIIFEVGGTLQDQSIAMFFAAMIQMPVLLFTPKFAKISPQKRLIFGMLSFIICLAILSVANSPVLVIIGMTINGIGYAINISSLRETSIMMCPKQMQSTAISLADAFQISLAGCVGTALSGVITEVFSMQIFMLLACILLVITTIAVSVLFKADKNIGEIK